MIKHTGIVLHAARGKKKHALLDNILGRIDVISYSRSFAPSTLISYHLTKQYSGIFLIDKIEIINMPLDLARGDLLFLHHVVELCYFFIPVNSSTEGIFELLEFLYTVEYSGWNKQNKKVFVLKLLGMIGYYPEQNDEQVQQWINCPLIMNQTLTAEEEQKIDEWLLHCMAHHPQIEQFKTVHFLRGSEQV